MNVKHLLVDVRVDKERKQALQKLTNTKSTIRVLWHHLRWRYYNNFKKIQEGSTIYQSCDNHDCGTRKHLSSIVIIE
jgi:hypothetical protein